MSVMEQGIACKVDLWKKAKIDYFSGNEKNR